MLSGGDIWDLKLFPDPVSKEGDAQPQAQLSTNGLLLHAVLMLRRAKTLNKTTIKSVCGPMNQSRPIWEARSLASKCPQDPHLLSEFCKPQHVEKMNHSKKGWKPSLMKGILLRSAISEQYANQSLGRREKGQVYYSSFPAFDI